MKKDWSQILTPTEKIIEEFSIGKDYIKWSFYSSLFIGILLLFGFIGFIMIPIVIFYWKFYIPRAHQYAFTNKRVLVKKGWLSTNLTSIDYTKITDVQVQETFLAKRFYKTGSLVINTAGTSAHEVILRNVENPNRLRQNLLELTEKVSK